MRLPFGVTVNIETNIPGPDFNDPEKRGIFYGNYQANTADPARDFTGMPLSVNTFFNIYALQGDVSACVRELCEGVGRKGYQWVDSETGADVANEPVSKYATRDLYLDDTRTTVKQYLDGILNNVEPWRDLKRDTVRDQSVAGNTFWALAKNVNGNRIVGVQRLDPRTLAIVMTKTGEVVRYIQRVNQDVVTFEPDEIVHFKRFKDPRFEGYGMSPLEAVVWEIRTDLAAMVSNYAFFQNDAIPAAIYVLDNTLPPKQQEKAVELITTQLKGAENRHKATVLSGVKEIKTLNIPQKDMEFLAGRKLATSKICAAYGVPMFLIGYTDEVNYSNSDNLVKNFNENTITPAEDDLANVVSRDFLPKVGIGGIEQRFNPQTLESEAALETRALAEYQAGILSLRQYKEKTRQKISDEDENNPNLDAHIVLNGASAVLLEDIGVNPDEGATNDQEPT